MERSPEDHDRIISLLAQKDAGSDIETRLDRLLNKGLTGVPSPESRLQAAEAIWSRLEEGAQGELAVQARELMGRLAEDPWAVVYLKKVFKILAAKQGWERFLESSYLTD